MSKKLIVISGGFDPIHIGHIRYINEAAKLGDLWVILNSHRFLIEKKGYVFMPEEQRKEIRRLQYGINKWREAYAVAQLQIDRVGEIVHNPAKARLDVKEGK